MPRERSGKARPRAGKQRTLGAMAWWRASDYYISPDGYVCPVMNASVERHDPWDEYFEGRDRTWSDTASPGRKPDLRQAPYHALLELAQELPPKASALGGVARERILEWYRLNGPLGLMVHQVLSVAYPPTYDSILTRIEEIEEDDEWFGPIQVVHTSTSGIWIEEQRRLVHLIDDELLDVARPGDPVGQDEPYYSPGHLTYRELGTQSIVQGELDSWLEHFPHRRHAPPLPGTPMFFGEYAESLDEFIRGARLLLHIAQVLASALGEPTRSESLIQSRPLLESLTHSVTPSVSVSEEGTLEMGWKTPTMLSALAMMLIQDSLSSGHLRLCRDPQCRLPFAASQARYCSNSCETSHKQVRYRAKKKARRLFESGLPAEEVARRVTEESKRGEPLSVDRVTEWASQEGWQVRSEKQ